MTTAEGGATREPSRIMVWLTHAMPALCAITLASSVPAWLGWTEINKVTYWTAFGGVIFLIGANGHAARSRMCVDCARQTPVDPQAAIDKHGWALFSAHVAGHRPWLTWAWLIVIMALGITAVKTTGITLFYAPWDVLFVSLCYVEWRHHYLQPWCPYCRGGWEDGGKAKVVPDPDPAEKATR